MADTNVTATTGSIVVTGVRPDVIQVNDVSLYPADTATRVAPGVHARFTMLQSMPPYIEDFESGFPSHWQECGTADGYSHTSWNGAADNVDIYADGGNDVVRMQGKGTVLHSGSWREMQGNAGQREDVVGRVKWHTGATAGLVSRIRGDAYAKVTGGVDGLYFWISSAGFNRGWISSGGAPSTTDTSAFTPVDGTWYWIRFQVYASGSYFRAKYWTGGRGDEPSAWSLAWAYPAGQKDLRDQRNVGDGFYCYAGTAYFDDFENRMEPDPDYAGRLSVEINGNAHTVADGTLRVSSAALHEDWDSVGASHPDITEWMVECLGRIGVDHSQRNQTAVVKWDNGTGAITLESWDWDDASFPAAPPIYDPDTESPSGDPDRIQNYTTEGSGTTIRPVGQQFQYNVWMFPESLGYENLGFNIADLTWITASHEDFIFNVYVPMYNPVDAEFIVGHSVWTDHPSSVNPALLVIEDHKANVVVKGSLGEAFPVSIVPQAYVRNDHDLSIIVSSQKYTEADASVIASAGLWAEFDASALGYEARLGQLLHIRLQAASTQEQWQTLGMLINPIIATTGRVVVTGVNPTVGGSAYQTVYAKTGSVIVTGVNPTLSGGAFKQFINATTGEVEVIGVNATVQATTKIIAGTGSIEVTGVNMAQIDDYFALDADEHAVGDNLIITMDKYLNRWSDPNPSVNALIDVYTYSSDQTWRVREVDAPGAYDWFRYLEFGCPNGKMRIRAMGYSPTANYKNSIRIRLHDTTTWFGFNVEYERMAIGDNADSNRGGTSSGHSAGPWTVVAQFDGSYYRAKRIDSLSPTMPFSSFTLNYSYGHTLTAAHKVAIAMGDIASTPADHGYLTKLEFWNDW